MLTANANVPNICLPFDYKSSPCHGELEMWVNGREARHLQYLYSKHIYFPSTIQSTQAKTLLCICPHTSKQHTRFLTRRDQGWTGDNNSALALWPREFLKCLKNLGAFIGPPKGILGLFGAFLGPPKRILGHFGAYWGPKRPQY